MPSPACQNDAERPSSRIRTAIRGARRRKPELANQNSASVSLCRCTPRVFGLQERPRRAIARVASLLLSGVALEDASPRAPRASVRQLVSGTGVETVIRAAKDAAAAIPTIANTRTIGATTGGGGSALSRVQARPRRGRCDSVPAGRSGEAGASSRPGPGTAALGRVWHSDETATTHGSRSRHAAVSADADGSCRCEATLHTAAAVATTGNGVECGAPTAGSAQLHASAVTVVMRHGGRSRGNRHAVASRVLGCSECNSGRSPLRLTLATWPFRLGSSRCPPSFSAGGCSKGTTASGGSSTAATNTGRQSRTCVAERTPSCCVGLLQERAG